MNSLKWRDIDPQQKCEKEKPVTKPVKQQKPKRATKAQVLSLCEHYNNCRK